MKKAILTSLTYTVATYVIISLFSAEINPMEWHWVGRVAMGLVVLTGIGGVFKKIDLL